LTILYWLVFALVVVGYLVGVYVILFGNSGLGYTRNSVESTPTDRHGQH